MTARGRRSSSPPWATVAIDEDVPEHAYLGPGGSLGPSWWACSQPERPHDGGTVWRVGCAKCALAWRADFGTDMPPPDDEEET